MNADKIILRTIRLLFLWQSLSVKHKMHSRNYNYFSVLIFIDTLNCMTKYVYFLKIPMALLSGKFDVRWLSLTKTFYNFKRYSELSLLLLYLSNQILVENWIVHLHFSLKIEIKRLIMYHTIYLEIDSTNQEVHSRTSEICSSVMWFVWNINTYLSCWLASNFYCRVTSKAWLHSTEKLHIKWEFTEFRQDVYIIW